MPFKSKVVSSILESLELNVGCVCGFKSTILIYSNLPTLKRSSVEGCVASMELVWPNNAQLQAAAKVTSYHTTLPKGL